MITEFDYKKYIVHDLPISQETYANNVKEFFGKSVYDFEKLYYERLDGQDFGIYINEKVQDYMLNKKDELTINDLNFLYSDEVYLARNICFEFILTFPKKNELWNHYEFFVPACLLRDKLQGQQQLYAFDHGSAMGWQGMLMWCLGYHVTFCDLDTKYFNFLKFQCKKSMMQDVDFVTVKDDKIKLPDRKFHFINSFFVFEHILNVEHDLIEITNHLYDGGYFNLRVDFSHGGLAFNKNFRYADTKTWKELLHKNRLVETNFFDDHIYQKTNGEVTL